MFDNDNDNVITVHYISMTFTRANKQIFQNDYHYHYINGITNGDHCLKYPYSLCLSLCSAYIYYLREVFNQKEPIKIIMIIESV